MRTITKLNSLFKFSRHDQTDSLEREVIRLTGLWVPVLSKELTIDSRDSDVSDLFLSLLSSSDTDSTETKNLLAKAQQSFVDILRDLMIQVLIDRYEYPAVFGQHDIILEAIAELDRYLTENFLTFENTDVETLKAILTECLAQGIRPFDMTKIIGTCIGLNDLQRNTLANAVITREISESAIQKMIDQMVRDRAEMIAITEGTRALNMGRQAHWLKDIELGLIDIEDKRRWIPASDACPNCLALGESEPVLITDVFRSEKYGRVQYPPAHVRCRCSIGLVPHS